MSSLLSIRAPGIRRVGGAMLQMAPHGGLGGAAGVTMRSRPDRADATPLPLYLRRREFLALGPGVTVAATALLRSRLALAKGEPPLSFKKGPYATDEGQTSYEDVTHYNNYYEFGTDKRDPAANAAAFPARPRPAGFR